ncbi:MAG TPA: hypothetical protein VMV00_00845 [Candidatus Baltobacteraceae bacterium]|nr:hypothetical protein [Candidatus Baltobacteraceae bacterium]
MGLKEDFIKIYSDLPVAIRNQIVFVLDGKPMTWNVAYIEVINDTKDSSIILSQLRKLGII